MSDVEKMYEAMRLKWVETRPGVPPKPTWHQLQPQHQMMLMQAFQQIILVMENA
jgi:hypothetical protein